MNVVATILSAALLAGTSAGATEPDPGVPAAPDRPEPVVHRADVDGDGRPDTVTLTRRRVTTDWYTFRITVRTATGRSAVRDVHVADYVSGTLTPFDVWRGTATVDGVRGAEINVDRGGNVGDAAWPHLYTWRAGRLVPLRSPESTAGWNVADHPASVAGYSFSTKRGRRYVTATQLRGRFAADGTVTYQGTRTTYRWRRGAWVTVSRARTGTLSEARGQALAGWQGLSWTP